MATPAVPPKPTIKLPDMSWMDNLSDREVMGVIIGQQKDVIKGIAGLQTTFTAVQQMFAMLATQLGTPQDVIDSIKEGKTTNENVKIIRGYLQKLYTDIYKGRIELVVKENTVETEK